MDRGIHDYATLCNIISRQASLRFANLRYSGCFPNPKAQSARKRRNSYCSLSIGRYWTSKLAKYDFFLNCYVNNKGALSTKLGKLLRQQQRSAVNETGQIVTSTTKERSQRNWANCYVNKRRSTVNETGQIVTPTTKERSQRKWTNCYVNKKVAQSKKLDKLLRQQQKSAVNETGQIVTPKTKGA